ncbi:MAG TPA: hypothetical protein DEX36_03000 [Glutamicibacter sp.]|nr:hypothetical protein [Glutamicibacter sp.]
MFAGVADDGVDTLFVWVSTPMMYEYVWATVWGSNSLAPSYSIKQNSQGTSLTVLSGHISDTSTRFFSDYKPDSLPGFLGI